MKQQSINLLNLQKCNASEPPPKRKKMYDDMDLQLFTIVENYHRNGLLVDDYLHSVLKLSI